MNDDLDHAAFLVGLAHFMNKVGQPPHLSPEEFRRHAVTLVAISAGIPADKLRRWGEIDRGEHHEHYH